MAARKDGDGKKKDKGTGSTEPKTRNAEIPWHTHPDLTWRIVEFFTENPSFRRRYFSDSTEAAQKEDRAKAVGKDSKTSMNQDIATFVFKEHPDYKADFAANSGRFGTSTGQRLGRLRKSYREHVTALGATGSGLKRTDVEEGSELYNAHQKILKTFPWWYELDAFWHELPNVNPIAVGTGAPGADHAGDARKAFSAGAANSEELDEDDTEEQRIMADDPTVAANVESGLVARENSRFIGGFRNIRHCEINLLRRIATQYLRKDGLTITCELATCEGSNQMFIVRSVVVSRRDEDPCRNVDVHERILEELSDMFRTDTRSSRIYMAAISVPGTTVSRFCALVSLFAYVLDGPLKSFFTVGDVRPLKDIFIDGGVTLSIIGHVVAKLLDATCHLRRFGAAWDYPGEAVESIYLDGNWEPKIGIVDDLVALSSDPEGNTYRPAAEALELLNSSTFSCTQESHSPRQTFRSALWQTELLGGLVDAGCTAERVTESTVRRADISSLVPLTQESMMYLLSQPFEPRTIKHRMWGNLLLRHALGCRRWQGSIIHVMYVAFIRYDDGGDCVYATCIEEDGETVRVEKTTVRIPTIATAAIRQSLGFRSPPDALNTVVIFELVRMARLGETSTECTGWRLYTLCEMQEVFDDDLAALH